LILKYLCVCYLTELFSTFDPEKALHRVVLFDF